MSRFYTAITLTLLAINTCLHAQVAPDFLLLPHHSVATTDNALSPVINPAGLGIRHGHSVYLVAPYQQKAGLGDWGIALGGEHLGFVGEFKRNDALSIRNRYTLGFGFGRKFLYLGSAYSWTKGVDRQNKWDIGCIIRPLRFVSFGAVVRCLNQPRVFDRFLRANIKSSVGWDLGLAFRPLAIFNSTNRGYGNRITLTADANLRKYSYTLSEGGSISPSDVDEYLDNISYKFGATIELAPGVRGYLEYLPDVREGLHAHDEQYSAGLTLFVGIVEAGVQQRTETRDGLAWLGATRFSHPTILKKHREKFVELRLKGPLVEYQSASSWWQPRYRTLYSVIRKIERYSEDPDVSGIVLRLENFTAGWAKLQEIRDALLDFMYTGKSVVVYLETCGNGGYYLASVADHIFMNPVGHLGLTGLSAHTMFMRRTLDWVGLDPQYASSGRYKSASDSYTREEMSDAQREALNSILDELFKEFIADIAEGRGYIEEQVRDLINDGPFTAADAFSAGLVDSLVYDDEIEDVLRAFFGSKTTLIAEKKHDWKVELNDTWDDLREKSIAIIFCSGEITPGESSEGNLFSDETMGSTTIASALRKARENKCIKAIVLRIDSPGGSLLASDIILREVKRCRDGDDRKPVIVSMSDVAGSGGYYIACMADTIIAMAGTITGSIGVVSGKMTYHNLLKKLKIGTETINRGNHADMWSGERSFTDEEWEKLKRETDQYYRNFVELVAEGREMDTSAVNEVAQGRIWTGSQAAEKGLVDLNGGLELAIQIAALAGNIREGESFCIKMFPRGYEIGIGSSFLNVMMREMPESIQRFVGIIEEETRWEAGEPLLLMPYKIEIK